MTHYVVADARLSKKFVCRESPSLLLSYNLIKLYILLFFVSALQYFFVPSPHYADIQRYMVT